MPSSDSDLIELLNDAADAVERVLASLDDWGLAGTQPGQYRSDLVADEAVTRVLRRAGVGVLSEESGIHEGGREIVVVVDPVDGSTNASRGLPWYAASLCAVDRHGARAALVVDLPRGRRFQAIRGRGASVDGSPLRPTACTELSRAIVGVSGLPSRPLGWQQYRALGSLALDLCEVARGGLDAFLDCSPSAHGPWDYLGGMLICREAGAVVEDALGRELVTIAHDARRTPLAAATPKLFRQVIAAHRGS
jgi:fructose-1,6-bisphosphatase/inositol monophosphatase family enzyme